MATTPHTATTAANTNRAHQTEISNTRVAPTGHHRGVFEVNAGLVARTLAAKNNAFTQPKPSAPMSLYALPDGSLTTSRQGAAEYDRYNF